MAQQASSKRELDAVVVGAGFAGLYALHRLRGLGLAVRVFEAGSGIGGTWFWNRYPGARCDIESLEYSYQFSEELQQEWEWSERYATQPEILRYLEHVADRFDLRRDIELGTRVLSAHFDEATGRWALETEHGSVSARFCIMATGCLSSANTPRFPGSERFAGSTYHTGRWPHEGVDFTGKRVGVIGTGSSAIQSIPLIAEQAAQLFVFQRTPTYSIPAHNGPLAPEHLQAVKADYAGFRRQNAQRPFGANFPVNEHAALQVDAEERAREYEQRWQQGGLGFFTSFYDLILDRAANETAAEFVRGKIRAIVRDPAVAEALSPKQVIGCKRLCVDTGYYATYNRPNVTLVDLTGAPIEEILPAACARAAPPTSSTASYSRRASTP
jgi:cation diffusion facilitator CzcD-associated flavoprotein CzcO